MPIPQGNLEAVAALTKLMEATEEMRRAQKGFFHERTTHNLEHSKKCERIVDKMLKELKEPASTQVPMEL